MTTERIAAAIKPILDEDRRADRERIAELERDLAALRCARENADSALEEHNIAQAKLIVTLNKQLDELTEKCAALALENKRLRDDDDDPERKPLDVAAMNRALDAAGVPPVKPEAPILRIDPDMSDPQPGKLLVVRLDGEDSYKWQEGQAPYLTRDQFVGFLVETPAVEVKRTPKVRDRVRFTADSNHPGIMGVVSHDLGDGAMLVSQGKSASHNRPNFVAMPTDIEVIE